MLPQYQLDIKHVKLTIKCNKLSKKIIVGFREMRGRIGSCALRSAAPRTGTQLFLVFLAAILDDLRE